MRKRFLALALVILLVFSISYPPAATASETAYSAYLNRLNLYRNTYGYGDEGDSEKLISANKGIYFAKLVDFNENGSEELIVAYVKEKNIITIEVWSCDFGSSKMVYNRSIMLNDGNSYYGQISTVTRDGKTFIYEKESSQSGSRYSSERNVLLELGDGDFVTADSWENSYERDDPNAPLIGKFTIKRGNSAESTVTSEEYLAFGKEMLSGTSYDVADTLNSMKITADADPRKLIAKLEDYFVPAQTNVPAQSANRNNLVLTMSDDDLKALNTFFSNFSESYLMNFDSSGYDFNEVVNFAFNHNEMNYQNRISYGNYNGYDSRLSKDYIEQTLDKYLGIKSITHKSTDYLKYENNYYYNMSAFGDTLKWSQVTEFYDNGDGTYSAVMDIYESHNPPQKKYERISKWNVRNWIDVWEDGSAVKAFTSAAICKPYVYAGKNTYVLTKLIYGQTTAPLPAASPNAVPTPSSLSVNGQPVSVDMYLINGENNYLKVRDFASMLNGSDKQFGVGYDSVVKTVTITAGSPYTPVGGEMVLGDGSSKYAQKSAYKLSINGKALDLTVYLIGDNNYYKLRDLCKALDIYVGYNDTTKAITLDTGVNYTD